MSEEFVNLDVFLKQNNITANALDNREVQLLLDGINETVVDNDSMIELYQAQGIKGQSKILLKKIGKCIDRPTIRIGNFDFDKYNCNLISYLLADVDVDEATQNSFLNLVSLHILQNTKTIGIISLEFHTFQHIKTNKSFKNMLDEVLDGTFEIFLKTIHLPTDYINKLHIGTLSSFPDKKNLIYIMLKYLSHNDVKQILK